MSAKNGKPCKKCGGNEWYANGKCAPCGREIRARWQKANPDKRKESNARWYSNNADKSKEQSKKWQRENPDKVKEINARWNKANPEKAKARATRWNKANPEKVKANNARWRRDNPDAINAIEHQRKTRKTAAGGSYTAAEWNALVEHYGHKCLCCGRTDIALTVDHVIPVVKGGTSSIDNIQPLCGSCNSRKRDNIIDYRPGNGLGRWIQKKLFG